MSIEVLMLLLVVGVFGGIMGMLKIYLSMNESLAILATSLERMLDNDDKRKNDLRKG